MRYLWPLNWKYSIPCGDIFYWFSHKIIQSKVHFLSEQWILNFKWILLANCSYIFTVIKRKTLWKNSRNTIALKLLQNSNQLFGINTAPVPLRSNKYEKSGFATMQLLLCQQSISTVFFHLYFHTTIIWNAHFKFIRFYFCIVGNSASPWILWPNWYSSENILET